MGRRLPWLLVSTLGLAGCLRLRGEPLQCYKQGDCGSEQVCRNGQCVSGAVQACPGGVCTPVATGGCSGTGCGVVECSLALKDQCVPYGCEQGQCLSSCSGAQECAPGFGCHGGFCLKSSGAACSQASECIGGYCCSGSCSDVSCAGGDPCAGCADPFVCVDGACIAPCANKACGTSYGVDCGECPSGQFCNSEQACRLDCEVGDYICLFNSVSQCQGEDYPTWVDDCDGELICVAGDAFCRTPCTLGEPRCENGVLGSCRADGTVDLSASSAQDCRAAGLSCTERGCGEVLTQKYLEWGPHCTDEIFFSAGLFQATQDITLYRFASPIDVFGPVTITYRVHESDQAGGPFYELWEGAVSMPGGGEFRHLGPLAPFVPLVGGRYYLLSVERSNTWAKIQCPREGGVIDEVAALRPIGVGLALPLSSDLLFVESFLPGVVPFDVELFTPKDLAGPPMGGAGGAL